MASTRKLMAGSKSENMELACKVLVRGYEFEARDLEMEFSSFGKVASISRSSELVQRAKPNVQKFVGEEDDQIPRAPRGLNPVNWRDPAGRESTTLAYRQKAIAASLSLAMSRFSDADLLILAKSSSLIKVPAPHPPSCSLLPRSMLYTTHSKSRERSRRAPCFLCPPGKMDARQHA